MKKAASVIVISFVCIALSVGIYLGSWWLREDSTDRNAQILQNTYGRQNALVEQILDDIEEANEPNIPDSQREALVDIVCDSYSKLTGSIQLPRYASSFIAQECP